ncbi:MAG: hypothetical protein P8X88_02230 [Gammaproteobacteria bacterium]
MESKINYFALLILIIFGVAVGNLMSRWITAKYLEVEVKKTSVEISKALSKNPKNTQQTIKKPVEIMKIGNVADQEQISEQRRLDDNGIRLAKTCNEWKVAHEDMNTQTSASGMTKHCEQYQKYINTGTLPVSP